jgi:hypothetical protein
MTPLLAQTSSAGSIMLWSIVLVILLLLGLVVVVYVRRRVTEPDEPSKIGFTLSDLRQMHKRGQMTDEEFEKAKAKIIGAAKAKIEPGTAMPPSAEDGRSGPI